MSTSEYMARSLLGRLRLPRLRELGARSIPLAVWAVGALVVVAALIRLAALGSQSYWRDEALTVYEARLPFGAMLNTVAHVETTPPLYFVLIWAWAKLFGTGEAALRSVSALAGIALVPIAYLSARELVSRWAGVLAAAFIAVNPFLVWYSQEARSYMLLATLTGASFLCFIRARAHPSARNLAWWAGLSSLAVMTHFFAGFAVAPEALWLLWISRTRAVALAVGVVAVAQVAMLPLALIDTSHGANWIAGAPRITRLGFTALDWGLSTLEKQATPTQGLIGGAILIVVIVLLLGLGGDRQTRRGAKPGALIACAVILIPLALGFIGQDYFISRNVISALLPLAVVIAAACVVPRARILGGILGAALIAGFSIASLEVQTHRYLQRPEWRTLAHTIGAATVPRAIFSASGLTANPLKIYLPNADWVLPRTRKVLISEIDVVGARYRQPLVADVARSSATAGGLPAQPYIGVATPRTVAPPGSRLVRHFAVNGWVVARFALAHPIKVDMAGLTELAPRFFRHVPIALLVFTQRPGR